jgi:hypothetical protein
MKNERNNAAESESAGKPRVSGVHYRNDARAAARDAQQARPRAEEKPVRISREEAQQLPADRDPDDPLSS